MARKVPSSFRPTPAVKEAMDKWLAQHDYIDKSTLINMALMRFVSQPQTLEGVQVVVATHEEAMAAFDQVMVEHAPAMEKLRNM